MSACDVPLEVADAAGADPGPLRQSFLGQAGTQAVSSYQCAKGLRLDGCRHAAFDLRMHYEAESRVPFIRHRSTVAWASLEEE